MDEHSEIQYFFDKCDEYTRSSFILARPRLVELLKSITASSLLTEAFTAVVSGFDYAKAKSRCLVTTGTKENPKHKLLLPRDPSDKLAFIFLLLCDFEKEAVSFNQFLFTYFDRNGNYAASFSAFCGEVIVPFRDIIYEAFYGDAESLAAHGYGGAAEETPSVKGEPEKKVPPKKTMAPAPRKMEEEPAKKAEAVPARTESKKIEPKAAEPKAEAKVEKPIVAEKEPVRVAYNEVKPEPMPQSQPQHQPTFSSEASMDGVNMTVYKLLSLFGKKKSGLFSRKMKKLSESISPLIEREKTELNETDLTAEEKSVGIILLADAEACLDGSDMDGLKIALSGYYYYISYNGFVSGNIIKACEAISAFENSDK